jgi:Undecaprenyl-phosphate glucose phosphotransferase
LDYSRTPWAQRTRAGRWPSVAGDFLPLGDFICLITIACASALFYGDWDRPSIVHAHITLGFLHSTLIAAVIAPFVLFDEHFGRRASNGLVLPLIRSHLVRFTLFFGIILVLRLGNPKLHDVPHPWWMTWLVLSFLLTAGLRVLVAYGLRKLHLQGRLLEVVAVVGSGAVATRLLKDLLNAQTPAVLVLGVFDESPSDVLPEGHPRTGSLEELLELGKARHIDWILLTHPAAEEQRLISIVAKLAPLSAAIGLCPQHVGLSIPYRTVRYVSDTLPVSVLADRPIHRWHAVCKSAEDLVLGSMMVMLLLPLFALLAVAIKIDSSGPILFKQRRHAANNHEFDIYKFRTMRWTPASGTERLAQTTRDDRRITRIGGLLRSWSLDELPQLFNVLRGEMSLVGPRPHAVDMRTEDQLGHEIIDIYPHRHRVKPGITGWSQVNGLRGATETADQLRRRVEFDLQYIEQWSLLFDLKILARTTTEVLRRTNAF